ALAQAITGQAFEAPAAAAVTDHQGTDIVPLTAGQRFHQLPSVAIAAALGPGEGPGDSKNDGTRRNAQFLPDMGATCQTLLSGSREGSPTGRRHCSAGPETQRPPVQVGRPADKPCGPPAQQALVDSEQRSQARNLSRDKWTYCVSATDKIWHAGQP